MGGPNASIPTPRPARYRPMFGAFAKPVVAVKNTRPINKRDMRNNDATPAD